ncbi:MAG: hypothetical protein ACRDH2_13400, partial [Anaerolineales bacterium]
LRTGDNQIRVVAQPASCSDGDEFGIFFRGALSDEGKFAGYLFKLNCTSQAGVDLMQDSTSRALLDWTDSPAVRPGAGAQNTLMVWMARNEFRFYVNDQYLASVKNATQTEGDFGFYLWKRGEGEARVAFDDLAIRAVTPP